MALTSVSFGSEARADKRPVRRYSVPGISVQRLSIVNTLVGRASKLGLDQADLREYTLV